MDRTKLERPFVSVIIPAYNPGPSLGLCVEALFSSAFTGFECIIVDDGSSSRTLPIPGIRKYPARVIRLTENHGPAYARNRGAAAAMGDYLVFLDDDVLVQKNTLDAIIAFFRENPRIDAVFGSYDNAPGHPGLISQYKNMFHHFIHQNSSSKASTFWAGCGAIKREVFLKVGGFRESFSRPSIEDIELGMRLVKNGYSIELLKGLQVKHLKKWSFFNMIKSDIIYRGIPWTMWALKYRMIRNELNMQWNARLSALCVFSYATAVPLFWGHRLLPYLSLFFLITFFLLNLRFYSFFYREKGAIFTLSVFPMHLLYYIYSGFSLMLGFCFYRFSNIRKYG